MKRPLSRLRLTPRGRLRRNVVLLLLLPLALLLVLRPCFTHQAALERLQSRFPLSARWTPPSGTRRRRSTPSAMTAGTPSAPWSASPFPRAHLAARCQGTDRRPGGRTPPLRLRHPL